MHLSQLLHSCNISERCKRGNLNTAVAGFSNDLSTQWPLILEPKWKLSSFEYLVLTSLI